MAGAAEADWLLWALAAVAEEPGFIAQALPRLRVLHILPLEDGTMAAGADGRLLELTGADAGGVADGAALAAATGARALAATFVQAAAARPAAARALGQLGVTRVEGDAFLLRHALPALSDPGTPAAALVLLLRFVRARAAAAPAASRQELLQALRSRPPRLVVADGASEPAPLLYLAAPYAPDDVRQLALAARTPFRCVSGDYLEDPAGAAVWSAFFQEIGLLAFPRVVCPRIRFSGPLSPEPPPCPRRRTRTHHVSSEQAGPTLRSLRYVCSGRCL